MRLAAGERLMELTEDDVLEILKLFEQSKFDFLQLEQGERKITVSKGGYRSARSDSALASAPVRLLPAAGAVPTAGAVPPAVPQALPPERAAPDPRPPPGIAPVDGEVCVAPSPSDPRLVIACSQMAAARTR